MPTTTGRGQAPALIPEAGAEPMTSLLARVRDAVRTQLWPLPTLATVLALVLGLVLPRLDVRLDASLPGWLSSILFTGDASAARTVLDAVSGSLITVTSLTFSLTVVTLQLASSQFSPRLLRTFTRDLFVQATLALFLATFTYSLTVLRSVHSSTASTAEAVPRISVTVSFVLAILSVIGLVLFLAHLAREIRVETMLRNVHQDASSVLRSVLAIRDAGETGGHYPALSPPTTAVVLLAPRSGFLVRIDESDLRDAAIEADAIVMIDCHPGGSLIEATPLGVAWPRNSVQFAEHTLATLRERVDRATHIGFERTAGQDVGYGLRQLTDVAIKALSPGINDPTTALHALGHISALLCEFAGRESGSLTLRDGDDVAVVLRRPDLTDMIDLAIEQPRRYGASDRQVVDRLYRLLGEVSWRAGVEHRAAIIEQLDRLHALVARQDFDQHELAHLAEVEQHARRCVVGSWAPPTR